MTEFVLAGGCFWCLDSAYSQFRGIEDVTCGYTGGKNPNPTYEQVCDGNTGHAEVVSVRFDESVIASSDILDIFFTLHDRIWTRIEAKKAARAAEMASV
jgi:peptide-methionine (S)-S-oxide reductase